MNRGEDVAILCRSNKECRQVYERLIGSGAIAANRIDLLGSQDFLLYQLRHSGALLDIFHTRNDFDFVEKYIWEELLEEYEHGAYADLQSGRDYLEVLYSLVREEVGRPRVRDLQTFIEEMRTSDVERLKVKTGLVDDTPKLTVATIHKVKGLQFKTVLVMPSQENFNSDDAAEEARLYYVAMTRARDRLYIGWEEREKHWLKRERHRTENSSRRYFFEGSPDEVFVSWPGYNWQVENGLQDYLKKQVCLGDPLELRTVERPEYQAVELRHQGQAVGQLSKDSVAQLEISDRSAQLHVSNVIRYTCGQYYQEHNPSRWDRLHVSVKNQGWFYTVLVEET